MCWQVFDIIVQYRKIYLLIKGYKYELKQLQLLNNRTNICDQTLK